MISRRTPKPQTSRPRAPVSGLEAPRDQDPRPDDNSLTKSKTSATMTLTLSGLQTRDSE